MTTRPGPSGPSAGVPDAARAVLSRMRAATRAAPGRASRAAAGRPAGRRRGAGGFSGPGPDERDPVGLAGAWRDLVADRGWGADLQGAAVVGMWADIVGPVNAEHTTPESFDAGSGKLVVRTASAAWAEQLRLMVPALHRAIEGRVGPGVVRQISIIGPTGRGRARRGPRHGGRGR